MTRNEQVEHWCDELRTILFSGYVYNVSDPGQRYKHMQNADVRLTEKVRALIESIVPLPPPPKPAPLPPPVGTNGVNGHTRLPLGKPAPAPPVGTNGVNGHTRLPLGKPAVVGRVGG